MTAAVLVWNAAAAADAAFPPLSVEISIEKPLFLFEDGGPAETTPEAYVQQVQDVWARLGADLQPRSAMVLDADRTQAHTYYKALLPRLQEAGLPVVARISSAKIQQRYPLGELEDLLRTFTTVKGVEVSGLAFNEYDLNAAASGIPLPQVQWLVGVIDTAARYGRFVYVPLDELHWARIMSNTGCAPLYDKIVACRDYVIPASLQRGPQVAAQNSALFGLWIEGAVANWGIASDSRWYADARFIAPNVFGLSVGKPAMPSPLYRAMMLNGAMTGATVYSFACDDDLWFGVESRHWNDAIYPTLRDLVELQLIERKDMILKKTKVAYQLAPSQTPSDFHLNLRDIDPTFDRGLLMRGAYGLEHAGQIPELVLNRGDHFWVPILSAHAPPEARAAFAEVVQPGQFSTPEQWTALLDQYASADGEGDAFIAKVKKGIFVMNSRENTLGPQHYALPAVPAPVRGLKVVRENGAISISWPPRENEYSWDVYRRVFPETRFTRIATVDQPRHSDQEPGGSQPIAYAVRALTNETEALEGTLQYGEYLALSTIFSRIVEEAVLSPVLTEAELKPVPLDLHTPLIAMPPSLAPAAGAGAGANELVQVEPLSPPALQEAVPWWPSFAEAPVQHVPVAEAIVKQIELWGDAFAREDFFALLDIYATDYEDPQGWQFQYVRRLYQWFIQRYTALRMDRQIRRWDFSNYESSGLVNVLLYCRLSGVAVSDTAGRIADQTVSLPRTESEETWISWTNRGGKWQIIRTNPALPSFTDLLSYSAGPYDNLPLGPDVYVAE